MASLRDLGLSEYEARAYRALLETGPTTAKELSRVSDVPMGRIYDVLNSIEQYNLVRSQSASRPKKYVAVEPAAALDRLLSDKKRELDAKAEQYESIVNELETELDTAEPINERFWTAAVGPDESVALLIERLDAADDRIVVVSSAPTLGFDIEELGERVTDRLQAAIDRGVEVSLLLSPELVRTLPPSVGRRYARTLADHPGFTVKTADVSGTFNVIDDNEVVVQVPNPLATESALAMIDLKDPEFATQVLEEFVPRWERADPLQLDGLIK